MLPAVVEQQAKLGVSTEESKAHRVQRQQARFRDRGGAFVPSDTNPLVNILLARTVSGESPSKPCVKDVKPSKSRRTSAVTAPGKGRAAAGSSKPKPAPRKRKEKAVVLQDDDTVTKPAPKRRGRPAKGKKRAPDVDTDTEQPPPDTKSKSTSKGKGKQRDTNTALSTPEKKSKPKAKPKPNTAKVVVEGLVSDDDKTLVDVPHKAKPKSKRNMQCEDDGETDDAPIVKKRVLRPADDSQASSTKTATGVKAEKVARMAGSEKKTKDGETTECPKTNAKKRVVPRGASDDDDDSVRAPPTKKGKAAKSASAKHKDNMEPELVLCTINNGGKSRATGHERGKGKAGPVEDDDDERPTECASKPKKRKKEDNYDDPPRKIIKFSDTGHPSSQKLKENQSDSGRKHKSMSKSSTADAEPATTKPPSRAKSIGPPPKVLERIKASAARHLQCADSEPDELDCLS